jgi:hypothetical protein
MRRGPVDKGRSARQFRGRVGVTHSLNVVTPFRGGFRL